MRIKLNSRRTLEFRYSVLTFVLLGLVVLSYPLKHEYQRHHPGELKVLNVQLMSAMETLRFDASIENQGRYPLPSYAANFLPTKQLFDAFSTNTSALLPATFLAHIKPDDVDILDQPPVPPYPPVARLCRIQGTVLVDIIINRNGDPILVTPVKGPTQLHSTALRFFSNCHFKCRNPELSQPFKQFQKSFQFKLN